MNPVESYDFFMMFVLPIIMCITCGILRNKNKIEHAIRRNETPENAYVYPALSRALNGSPREPLAKTVYTYNPIRSILTSSLSQVYYALLSPPHLTIMSV